MWDVFPDEIVDVALDDGLEVRKTQQSEYFTFASSIEWNEGVHVFTLKQLDSSKGQIGISDA